MKVNTREENIRMSWCERKVGKLVRQCFDEGADYQDSEKQGVKGSESGLKKTLEGVDRNGGWILKESFSCWISPRTRDKITTANHRGGCGSAKTIHGETKNRGKWPLDCLRQIRRRNPGKVVLPRTPSRNKLQRSTDG